MPDRGPLNPYQFGGPVEDENRFYGRHDLVEAVINTLITTGQNALVLHGQRRIGKTSLLYRLKRDPTLCQKHTPIFFTLQSVSGSSPAGVLAALAKTVAQELSLDISLSDEASLARAEQQFQSVFLPQVYPHLEGKRLLFLLDEFDVVLPTAAADLPRHFLNLLEEEKEHTAFIFVIGQRLELLVDKGLLRLFKGARSQQVGRFGKEDTLNLLTELGKKGNIRYSDEALAEIWALTKGHPYITQAIGSEIFDRLRNRETRSASLADVEKCLDNAMEHAKGGLNWFWDGFSTEERLVLAAVAELSDRQRDASDARVDEALRDHRFVLGATSRRKAYKQLVAGELLLDAGQGRYQFCVEFIRRWITKDHPLKEQIIPAAEALYQAGLAMYQSGRLDQAIDLFRKALEEAPLHSNSQLALMRALRATSDIEGAIEAGERAYELSPDDARRELVDLHNEHSRTLLEGDPAREEDAIGHARRVLEIASANTEARRFLSEIYLHRAETDMQASQLETARQAVQQLVEPERMIDDKGVSECVRKLWLDYSRQITEGESPQWVAARQTLDTLETWGIMNEEIIARYNEIGLNEAGAFLEQDDLERALGILRDRLKSPRPDEKLSNLLVGYSQRQQDRLCWERAEDTLQGLQHLGNDDQGTQSALSTLYHRWGDHLCREGQFEKAIDIYQRGRPESEFEPKTEQARQEKEEQYIQQQLDDAQAAFDQQQFAEAIEHLRRIPAQAGPRVKSRIRNNLAQWANRDKWADGAEALKELGEVFVDDLDVRPWYVNWLYFWAQALLKDQVTAETMAKAQVAEEAMVEAKRHCREILAAGVDTAVLDLRGASTPASADEHLPRKACALCAEISLRQAQIRLGRDDLTGAQDLFKEALDLPLPPENLQKRIQEMLRRFAQDQVTKEEWEQATHAFAVLQALQLYDDDPEIEQDFRRLIMLWARLRLKADQPVQAFEVLNRLGPEVKTELRQWGKETLYQFCWLYAGRDQEDLWDKAEITVHQLREWLVPPDKEKMGAVSNVLLREKGESHQNRLAAQSTPRETSSLEDLEYTVNLSRDGYDNANKYSLDKELPVWVEKLMNSRLAYGDALLVSDQLTEAMQNYQQLLCVGELTEAQRADVNLKITNALYVYSERMRREKEWNKARKALEQLKGLGLPPREGKLQDPPDRRIDGAIQRVMLDQARAWLKDDRFDDTFGLSVLQTLPRPWPDRAVKQVIRIEGQERSQGNDWENAVEIYRRLDGFLIDDRDQVRDQEALEWLVEGLEGWGRYLEDQSQDHEAADHYYEGLFRTREAARPRNVELADQYIKAKLRLAQEELGGDDWAPEAPPQIKEAIRHYKDILSLEPPERTEGHTSRLNQALYAHACKLAEAERWGRAYQILDYLDSLYLGRKETDHTLFATWRRELFLREINAHVQAGKVDEAISRLGKLQGELIERNAPNASWADSRDVVVGVGQGFYEHWCEEKDWEPAARFLDELAQCFDGDREVMGWEVDVLCRWGESLRAQESGLEEAIVKYEDALAKAPEQEQVPAESIELALLYTQLQKAEKALDRHDLAAAKETCQRILEKPADHLGRGSKVCDALSRYSDRLAGETPPQWAQAHDALRALSELPVDQGKVLAYRQNLTLRHMDALLEQDDVEGAFKVLEAPERPWSLEGIRGMVLKHTKRWGPGRTTWGLATRTFKRLGDLAQGDVAARQWVVGELTNLGDLLAREERQNLEGADEAYRLAYELDPESAAEKLVTTRLKRAEQALDRDDLEKAHEFSASALEVQGEHPERADDIRKVLEEYSDKVSGRKPAGQDLAQRALEMIPSLELQTDETQLNKADFWLKQAEIDRGFKIFSNLTQATSEPDQQVWLDRRISEIVRNRVAEYARYGQWGTAKRIIEMLEGQWPGDDKRRDWLQTASDILTAAEQTKPGPRTKPRERDGDQEPTEAPEKPKPSKSWLDRLRKGLGDIDQQ